MNRSYKQIVGNPNEPISERNSNSQSSSPTVLNSNMNIDFCNQREQIVQKFKNIDDYEDGIILIEHIIR